MKARRPRLEVVIDEIVLRGVPPDEAHRAVAALEARLAVLGEDWALSGAMLDARDEAGRRTPTVALPTTSPTDLGDAVAGAVWNAATSLGDRR